MDTSPQGLGDNSLDVYTPLPQGPLQLCQPSLHALSSLPWVSLGITRSNSEPSWAAGRNQVRVSGQGYHVTYVLNHKVAVHKVRAVCLGLITCLQEPSDKCGLPQRGHCCGSYSKHIIIQVLKEDVNSSHAVYTASKIYSQRQAIKLSSLLFFSLRLFFCLHCYELQTALLWSGTQQ